MTDPNEEVVLKSLKDGEPKTLEEIAKDLAPYSETPERHTRKIAWKLVEEGKARFNDDWLLEERKS